MHCASIVIRDAEGKGEMQLGYLAAMVHTLIDKPAGIPLSGFAACYADKGRISDSPANPPPSNRSRSDSIAL